MKIHYATLATCSQADGTVVIIDVLRAFTTAAYAFAAGAQEIILVRTVEQALSLRERIPHALALGEVDGLPVKGFDISNSPTELAEVHLSDRRLIQRTSAGTQGVVLSSQADDLLASSFANANATALYIQRQTPTHVTFVITGAEPEQVFDGSPIARGDEDLACAEYIAALLQGDTPDPEPFLRRVSSSPAGRKFVDSNQSGFLASDLEYCTRLDQFDFAMRVEVRSSRLVMRSIHPTPR